MWFIMCNSFVWTFVNVYWTFIKISYENSMNIIDNIINIILLIIMYLNQNFWFLNNHYRFTFSILYLYNIIINLYLYCSLIEIRLCGQYLHKLSTVLVCDLNLDVKWHLMFTFHINLCQKESSWIIWWISNDYQW